MPPKGSIVKTLEERFKAGYVVAPNGCWIWQKANYKGYGLIAAQGQKRTLWAHRVSYELKYGPVPEGLVLDHFYCQTPACVNPDHVEAVTQAENFRRNNAPVMVAHRTKTCLKGHPLEGDNLGIQKGRWAFCRICKKQADFEANKRHTEKLRSQRQVAKLEIYQEQEV
jgi:hypothetical protein